MKLLNVGCGGHRPQDDYWWNLDALREHLKPGTPERTNLDAEPRYIECNLLTESIHVPDGEFDGILVQHVLEHFTCHDAVEVILKCRRVLKDGGILVASVPDAAYFMSVSNKDTRETAVELFGESISGDWHDAQCNSFFDYALFHREHKQILTHPGLAALLFRAGFRGINDWRGDGFLGGYPSGDAAYAIGKQLNRLKFSAILWADK